jgi:hypothetical protein
MTTPRLPLPAAYMDPAFIACLSEAIGARELVQNFDRLYGANMLTRPAKEDMAAFTRFVHDGIYLRLPDEALDSLRAAALPRGEIQ